MGGGGPCTKLPWVGVNDGEVAVRWWKRVGTEMWWIVMWGEKLGRTFWTCC